MHVVHIGCAESSHPTDLMAQVGRLRRADGPDLQPLKPSATRRIRDLCYDSDSSRRPGTLLVVPIRS